MKIRLQESGIGKSLFRKYVNIQETIISIIEKRLSLKAQLSTPNLQR